MNLEAYQMPKPGQSGLQYNEEEFYNSEKGIVVIITLCCVALRQSMGKH